MKILQLKQKAGVKPLREVSWGELTCLCALTLGSVRKSSKVAGKGVLYDVKTKKNVSVTAIYNIPLFNFISQQIDAQVHQYVRVNNEQRIYIFTSFFSKS